MKNSKRNTQYAILNTKRITVIFFLILLWLVLPQTKALAATYYLDASRPDDSGDGTMWITAKKTLSGMSTLLDALSDDGAGDTVEVNDGNYGNMTGGVWAKDTRTDWLKIEAAAGKNPVLTEVSIFSGSYPFVNNAYLWLKGWTIAKDGDVSYDGYTAHIRGKHVRYQNCTIKGQNSNGNWRDGGGMGSWTKGLGLDMDYQEVIDCNITSGDGSLYDGFSYGIYISGDNISVNNCTVHNQRNCITVVGASNCSIQDSDIHDSPDDLIVFGGTVSNFTIEDTSIHDLHPRVAYTLNGSYVYTAATKTISWVSGDKFPLFFDGVDDFVRISDASGYITGLNGSRVYEVFTDSGANTDVNIILSDGPVANHNDVIKVEMIDASIHGDCVQFNADAILSNITFRRVKIYNGWIQGLYLNQTTGSNTDLTLESCLLYGFGEEAGWREKSSPYGSESTRALYISGVNTGSVTIKSCTIAVLAALSGNYTLQSNCIKYLTSHYNTEEMTIDSDKCNIFGYIKSDTSEYDLNKDATTTNLNDSDMSTWEDMFTNPSTGDFTPKVGSLAINYVADPNYATTMDILGSARDQSPDAGAYEYGTSTTFLLYGDVNNDKEITAYDAALAARLAVGLDALTTDKLKVADVNGDSEVTAYDAALIAQKAVGLIEKFPVK